MPKRYGPLRPPAEAEPLRPSYAAEPAYTHDCDICGFVGRADGLDIYWCDATEPDSGQWVVRYSSIGSDYVSAGRLSLAELLQIAGGCRPTEEV